MTTITATQAKTSLSGLLDTIYESHEPVHIKGKRRSAVLVAEEDWKSIQETLMLTSIAGMRESIKEGMATPIEECSKDLDW